MLKSIGLVRYLQSFAGQDTLPIITSVQPTDFSWSLPFPYYPQKFTPTIPLLFQMGYVFS
jgi:hypothetical protein